MGCRPAAEGGGAGRPGARPEAVTKGSEGHVERPARSAPTAAWRLDGLSTMPGGVSEPDFAASAPPCPRACVEGSPGSFPAKSEVGTPGRRRSAGLAAMPGSASDCGPRLLSEGRSQESRRLISEARAREHIAARPSPLIRIHCESRRPIPMAQNGGIALRRADYRRAAAAGSRGSRRV
jgi:hypothetical protein